MQGGKGNKKQNKNQKQNRTRKTNNASPSTQHHQHTTSNTPPSTQPKASRLYFCSQLSMFFFASTRSHSAAFFLWPPLNTLNFRSCLKGLKGLTDCPPCWAHNQSQFFIQTNDVVTQKMQVIVQVHSLHALFGSGPTSNWMAATNLPSQDCVRSPAKPTGKHRQR